MPLDEKRVRAENWHKLSDYLFKSVVFVAVICFIGMLALAIAQILFRYVFEIAVLWFEELARILFTTSMFLGIAVAAREREHITITFLRDKIGNGRIISTIIQLIVFLFLAYLSYGALGMTLATLDTYQVAIDWLCTGWLYGIETFATGLTAIYVLVELIGELRGFKNSEEVSA